MNRSGWARSAGAVIAAAVVSFGITGIAAGPVPAEAAKTYPTCAKLLKDYPRGIAHPRARVSPTSGKIVWNKTGTTREKYKVSRVNRALYNANTARDRDKDRVACEQS
jgi:hypothetical protein